MPTSKSAEKRVRVSERRRVRNKSIRSEVKTRITSAEGQIFAGQLEAARQSVTAAISSLDEAAEKGILKTNNSARRKSRLMKKLNRALASAASGAEPKTAEPKKAEPKKAG
ncbi:MAG: 30S ribosomal protein S20 [Chloroflexota bacterium]